MRECLHLGLCCSQGKSLAAQAQDILAIFLFVGLARLLQGMQRELVAQLARHPPFDRSDVQERSLAQGCNFDGHLQPRGKQFFDGKWQDDHGLFTQLGFLLLDAIVADFDPIGLEQ